MMTYEIAADTAAQNNGCVIIDNPGQFEHRGMILREVCELEFEFKLLLLSALRKLNASLDEKQLERKGIFYENNMLGTLSKCLELAKVLALVNDEEHEDLSLVVRLRNMYAHGRARQQLYHDDKAMGVIREITLVKNSTAVLAKHDEQGTFLSCCAALREIIVAKRTALEK